MRPRSSSASSSARRSSCSRPSSRARCRRSRACIAVWIASGILTLFGALIAAELASAYPHAGGVYVFLREAFSPAVGFLWGWAMFWTMHTGIIAVIAMVFARYVAFFLPVGDTGTRLLAVGAVIALTAVNYVGVRQGSLVQTTLTILKVAAVARDHRVGVRARSAKSALRSSRTGVRRRRPGRAIHVLSIPPRGRRRPVRVRRLAHGDVRRRGDARSGAHDPARAARRRADRDRRATSRSTRRISTSCVPTRSRRRRASPPTRPTRCSGAAAPR